MTDAERIREQTNDEIAKEIAGNFGEYLGPDLECSLAIHIHSVLESKAVQLEAMKGENGVLLEAIERYGEHTDHCVFTMQHRGPQEPISCCCGFDDALKRTPSTYRKRGEAIRKAREALKAVQDDKGYPMKDETFGLVDEALALLTESETPTEAGV